MPRCRSARSAWGGQNDLDDLASLKTRRARADRRVLRHLAVSQSANLKQRVVSMPQVVILTINDGSSSVASTVTARCL